MNWVGGARKRISFQGEKKRQREFFERKKLEIKQAKNKSRPVHHVKQNSISRDLLALQTVSNMELSFSDIPKPVRKLNLDKFQPTVCGRRCREVCLPASPNEQETPSYISLYEQERSVERSSLGAPRTTSSSDRESSTSTSAATTAHYQPSTFKPHLQSITYARRPSNYGPRPSNDGPRPSNTGPIPLSNNESRKPSNDGHKFHVPNPFETDLFQIPKNVKVAPYDMLAQKPCLKSLKRRHNEQYLDVMSHYPTKAKVTKVSDDRMAGNPWAVEDFQENFQTTPLLKYEYSTDTSSFSAEQEHKSFNDLRNSRNGTMVPAHFPKPYAISKYSWTPNFEDAGSKKFVNSPGRNPWKGLKNDSGMGDDFDNFIENRFSRPRPAKFRTFVNKSDKNEEPRGLAGSCQQGHQQIDKFYKKPSVMASSSVGSESNPTSGNASHSNNRNIDTQDLRQSVSTFSDLWKSEIQEVTDDSKNLCAKNSFQQSSTIVQSNIRNDGSVDEKCASPREGRTIPKLSDPNFSDLAIKFGHRGKQSGFSSSESPGSSCSEDKTSSCYLEVSDMESPTLNANTSNLKWPRRVKATDVGQVYHEVEKESLTENIPSSQHQNTDTTIDTSVVSDEDSDDVITEVSLVLQGIVHKVALLNIQHATDLHSDFIIPSRSITSMPWKTIVKAKQDGAQKESQNYNLDIDVGMNCVTHQQTHNLITDNSCEVIENISKRIIKFGRRTSNWSKLDLVASIKLSSVSYNQSHDLITTEGIIPGYLSEIPLEDTSQILSKMTEQCSQMARPTSSMNQVTGSANCTPRTHDQHPVTPRNTCTVGQDSFINVNDRSQDGSTSDVAESVSWQYVKEMAMDCADSQPSCAGISPVTPLETITTCQSSPSTSHSVSEQDLKQVEMDSTESQQACVVTIPVAVGRVNSSRLRPSTYHSVSEQDKKHVDMDSTKSQLSCMVTSPVPIITSVGSVNSGEPRPSTSESVSEQDKKHVDMDYTERQLPCAVTIPVTPVGNINSPPKTLSYHEHSQAVSLYTRDYKLPSDSTVNTKFICEETKENGNKYEPGMCDSFTQTYFKSTCDVATSPIMLVTTVGTQWDDPEDEA